MFSVPHGTIPARVGEGFAQHPWISPTWPLSVHVSTKRGAEHLRCFPGNRSALKFETQAFYLTCKGIRLQSGAILNETQQALPVQSSLLDLMRQDSGLQLVCVLGRGGRGGGLDMQLESLKPQSSPETLGPKS